MVVTGPKPADPVIGGGTRGEEEHRDTIPFQSDGLYHGEAVDSWEHDIHDDGIEMRPSQPGKRIRTGMLRRDRIPLHLKVELQCMP